jgi:hypothetical protein
MSPIPFLRRALPLVLLLMSLVFTSLPVQALPATRSGPTSVEMAVLGAKVAAWIRELVTSLWPRDAFKEGTSVDPDGPSNHQEGSDEGVLIDPNG